MFALSAGQLALLPTQQVWTWPTSTWLPAGICTPGLSSTGNTRLWSCGMESLQIPLLCHPHGAQNAGTSSSCAVPEVSASCTESHLSPHPDTILQPGSLDSPSSSPRPRTVAQLEQNRMTGPRAGLEYSQGSEHLTSSKLSPLPSPRLVMGTRFDCL